MNIKGANITPSKYFHGRYEVHTYGLNGRGIKQWIRDTFGETDDMVYANSFLDGFSNNSSYDSLITREQLSMLLLKWA